MVRKISAICLLIGSLLFASPMQTYANSIYEDGNISSTFLDIATDLTNNISVSDDYIFFRSGQYDYTFIYGNIDFTDGVFSSSTYNKIIITTNTSGYNQTRYHYEYSQGSNLSLTTSDYLVYSNLGHYPNLIERGVYYEYTSLFVFVVVALCMLMRPIFNFVLRFRNGA